MTIWLISWLCGWTFSWGLLHRHCDDWRDEITMPVLLLAAWPFFLAMHWMNR